MSCRKISLNFCLPYCWLLICGCSNPEVPFDMAPACGRITYSDGSPIEAAVVKAYFVPQNVAAVGDQHPRPAETTLSRDGSFANLTTCKKNDGIIVGRHKIVLEAFDADMRRSLEAVDAKYRDVAKTPLQVEVTRDGPNRFELTVDKGS